LTKKLHFKKKTAEPKTFRRSTKQQFRVLHIVGFLATVFHPKKSSGLRELLILPPATLVLW